MKIILHCLFVVSSLAIGECWSADEPARESSAKAAKSAEIQEWQNKGFFSEDFDALALSGDIGAEPEAFWKTVSDEILHFKHRDKVKEIALNDGYISRASLESLAQFPNVEQLTLGFNPEGVTVPPSELRGILKFAQLKCLYVAMHGMKNDHFLVLSELKKLEVLSIDFGSRHMVGTEKSQIVKWSPAKSDDEATRFISRMKSFSFHPLFPEPDANSSRREGRT